MVASTTPTSPSLQNGVAAEMNGNSTLPPGKYTLVGIDIDTTGRRLIDEIVQLAAYTPKDHFEQYIMPYMNLNPAARQRHQVRVISIGFYRMLKSMQTYKIIKSKSEIAALKDFLDWLEALTAKDAGSQGVILLYHEERKFIPYMILESLKKYNLLDRFLNTVKSFANGLNLAKANANESLQHYSLRKLSKFLKSNNINGNGAAESNNPTASANAADVVAASSTTLEGAGAAQQQKSNNSKAVELFDGSASVRAKLAYEVALQLSNQDPQEPLASPIALDNMHTALSPYAQPIVCDLNELQTQNQNLERQNSFRPVFLNYFKMTLYHRVRAVKFRIILAEHGYDLQTLNAIWTEKKRDGLVEVLQVMEELKEEDRTELADLFDSYYDPSKTTIKPIVKSVNRPHYRRGARSNRNDGNTARFTSGAEQGAGGDKRQQQQQQQQQQQGGNSANLPDSTTKSPKSGRGKRNQRPQKNSGNNNNNDVANNNTTVKTESPVGANINTSNADATVSPINNATPAAQAVAAST